MGAFGSELMLATVISSNEGQSGLDTRGLLLQAGALTAESCYLLLTKQIMHQKAGHRPNRAWIMQLHMAPASFIILLPFFVIFEMKLFYKYLANPNFTPYPLILNVSTLQGKQGSESTKILILCFRSLPTPCFSTLLLENDVFILLLQPFTW
jgi:hypothetical protein